MRPDWDTNVRVARAWVPGHVTGLFAPAVDAADPRARGSVGAGVVLDRGALAVAAWFPAARRHEVRVSGDISGRLPISEDAAGRIFARKAGRLEVLLSHELPVGQGFGMSGSGALATALATAAATRTDRQRAIEVAHLADLFGRGGLGGVASVLAGGFEIRERAGVPPFGRVTHHPFPFRLLLATLGGPLPSPDVLRDARVLERVTAASDEGLRSLRRHPSAELLLREGERFTDAVGLGSPGLRRLTGRLRAAGCAVMQAMFGRALVVVPRSNSASASAERTLRRAGALILEARALDPRGGPRVEVASA